MSASEFDGILSGASWRRVQTNDERPSSSSIEVPVVSLDSADGEATVMAADAGSLSPFMGGMPPNLGDAEQTVIAAALRPTGAPPPAPQGALPPAPQDAPTPAPQGAPPSPEPAENVPELPPSGTRIDQYELIRELGRGGMGAVFLARDTKLARRVAIKFLLTGQSEISQRFFQEAQATAQFNHENIVVIHDYGEFQQNPYMVLEFLQGAPLSKMLRGDRKLPVSRTIELMLPVVKALVAAHEHNIVHRDLKPDNIFVTDAGTIKVLDFGIAKILQSDEEPSPPSALLSESLSELSARVADHQPGFTGPTGQTSITGGTAELTRSGAIMGTLPYMSPEQWGMAPVDHRTDIWAVGILLFRMLTGRHPLYPLRGQQLVVTAMVSEPMPTLRSKDPSIDAGLAEVIDRCLRKNKDERIGSAKELLRALEPFRPGGFVSTWEVDESPYAGLSAFQEADASRFFGRSREIAVAVTRLRDHPLLGIVGPSGAGKSSFVRAGVVPMLKQSGEQWETLVVRPGRQPMLALANVVATLLATDETMTGHTSTTSLSTLAQAVSEQQEILQRLYREPGFLGTVLRSRARRQNGHIMLFIDQFEELYTLIPDYNERMTFTSCLAGVADDATAPLRVVISIRSDFIDRVAEDPRFMAELTQGLFFLAPPNRVGLREALIMPAQMAGFSFERTAMIDDMLDHLANTPGALPLLQFAATKLWDKRDADRKLFTDASYRAIGGVMGALASHADSVLSDLPSSSQRLVRAIFLHLVTSERTRAIVSIGELFELSPDRNEVQRLIDHLVQARLLMVQTGDTTGGGSEAQVEIVHESMIHSWPMLRRWLDENQDDAAFLEQLRNATKQWHTKGRPPGLLWRGETMEEARRWHKRYRGQLPDSQRQYLNAVFALARRAIRWKRIALSSVIVILSLMVAAAAVALVLIRDAEKQATGEAARAVEAETVALAESERAKKSEEEAKQALAKQLAESKARKVAEKGKERAESDLEEAYQELQEKAEGLAPALEAAEKANRRARRAQADAEASAQEALSAQEVAERERSKTERLLTREKKRRRAAEKRIGGGKRVDILK